MTPKMHLDDLTNSDESDTGDYSSHGTETDSEDGAAFHGKKYSFSDVI